jgi:uncharacterized protein (TIGR00297 family)
MDEESMDRKTGGEIGSGKGADETPVGVVWRKAIPQGRDRWQSQALLWGMGSLLSAMIGLRIVSVVGIVGPPRWFFASLAVSVGFAVAVWGLKAATKGAAILGGAICLVVLTRQMLGVGWTETAMPELAVMLVLTLGATKYARRSKGKGEGSVRGRTAAQVAANLGWVAYLASAPEPVTFVAGLGALAEVAADTVSSEMGYALGGKVVLITTGRRVEPGTDGAMSVVGTALGMLAAGVVAGSAVAIGAVDGWAGLAIFLGGSAGMFFDSVLGATVERRGWLGNDLVNFLSTVFAAKLAGILTAMVVRPSAFW